MTTPASETFGQARQGSVAAIIQVLNERLAEAGIRTRAVVADGMLQILCEAATPEQLDKKTVVERVRDILETISPQRIKKVKINSRIVKEEQLLWLEEINRDPENSLLWAEIVNLKRPFFIKRWLRDRNLKPAGPLLKDISEPEPPKSPLSSKFVGGAGLILLLLAAGWLFREDLSQIQQVGEAPRSEDTPAAERGTTPAGLPALPAPTSNPGNRTADTTLPPQPDAANSLTGSLPPAAPSESVTAESPAAEPPATQPSSQASPATASPNRSGPTADAFAEAVRIAEQAGIDGQTASTAAEWLDLAARWQRASDLMAQIPDGSEEYARARERIETYATNSQSALQKAAAAQE